MCPIQLEDERWLQAIPAEQRHRYIQEAVVARLIQEGRISLTAAEEWLGSLDGIRPLLEVVPSDERLFRALFEAAPIGLALLSTDGRIVRANPALYQILGYRPGELEGRSFREITHPDDQERGWRLFQELVRGERNAYTLLKRYLRKDGPIVWGGLSVSALRDEQGQLLYVIAMVADISEAIRSRRQLEHIVRSINGLLWRADVVRTPDGHYDWTLRVADLESAQRFLPLDLSSYRREHPDIPEEVLYSWAWHQAKLPDDREMTDRNPSRAFEEGLTGYQQEYRVRDATGKIRWLFEDVQVEKVGEGRWSVTGFAVDITRQKQLERQLAEKTEQLETMMEAFPDRIFRLAADGTVLDFHAHDVSEMAMMPEQFLGKRVQEVLPPPHGERAFRVLQEALRTRKVVSFEYSVPTEQGTRYFEARVAAMSNQQLLAVVREITERVRMEQALRESEERYRDLIESASDLIQSVGPDGRFLYVNRAWKQRMGYTDEEIASMRVFDVVHPDAVPKCREIFRRVLEGENISRVEVDFVTKHGEVLSLEGSISCRLQDGRPVATRAIFRDITERKRIDRMKNEFISVVSHELRTPMTSIQGALGLLLMGAAGDLPEETRRLLEIAHNNADRLVRLINDILDLEKIESGKMTFHIRPVSLREIAQRSLESTKPYADQFDVQLLLEPGDDPVVLGDSDRLQQVMVNLVSNAVKFSPKGGTVRVRIERQNGRVRVSVQDSGPGIPEEFRDKIFDKFTQADSSTRREKGGTGLGLAICKAIIDRLGGTIAFDTEVGKGTTFYFELPEYTEGAAEREPFQSQEESSQEERRPKEPILIVEDDPDVAGLLSAMLRRTGFRTDVAYSAKEARQKLRQNEYAAMTLDLLLGDDSGLDLLKELRSDAKLSSLPVVVVSAYVDENRDRLNGTAFPLVDWIAKPIDQERLLRAVQTAVRQRQAPRARVLYVEDDPDLHELVTVLVRDFAEVEHAHDLAQARQKLQQGQYDLVILDQFLPDGHGLELLSELGDTPVLVFSVDGVDAKFADRINAELVKSRTTNAELADTIARLLARSSPWTEERSEVPTDDSDAERSD